MKQKIILRCVLLCLAVLLLSGAISAFALQYQKQQSVEKNMEDLLAILILEEKQNNRAYGDFVRSYQATSMKYRITLLDLAGDVLSDTYTDRETMQNHADRPEFKEAVATGTGTDRRKSATLGQDMLYVARRDGDVVYRIAAPLDSIRSAFWAMVPSLLAGLAAALIAAPFLASRIARGLTRPLEDAAESLRPLLRGEYEASIPSPEYRELQPVVDTIRSLTEEISAAMRALTEQKEKTEYLIDNMEEGLVLVDRGLRVRQINAAARRFFGGSRSGEGEPLLLFTHQRRLVEAMETVLREGGSSLFDLERALPDGRLLSAHITAIHPDWLAGGEEDGGRPTGAVALLTDVTQERQARRIRSEFVANASHELKTPITSIGGFAELLAAGAVKDPEKQREYLGRIQHETRRMAGLIEDILRLSRLESGAEESRERVELDRVAAEALAGLRPQLERAGITAEMETEPVALWAVPDDLRSLAGNLLDNAVKYNRPGGRVRVTLRREGNRAIFAVADTGVGIPPEHQSRIFERFYRAGKGGGAAADGTGLGLAIVKHVAGKYGGEIALRSREGEGTEITVSLPIPRRSPPL